MHNCMAGMQSASHAQPGRQSNCVPLMSCSKCQGEIDRNGRYCKACHNASMRSWRRNNPPTELERQHGIARSYANVYKSRGRITPTPCEQCSELAVQMHHDNYSLPLAVRFLCAPCHRNFHINKPATIIGP